MPDYKHRIGIGKYEVCERFGGTLDLHGDKVSFEVKRDVT